MTEDIVTRLRNRAAEGWLEHDQTCCPDCADDVAFGREMIAAADEIERLREINRNLHTECDRMNAERRA